MTIEQLSRIVRENLLVRDRLNQVVSEGGHAFHAYVPNGGGVGQTFTKEGKTLFQLSQAREEREPVGFAWVVEVTT